MEATSGPTSAGGETTTPLRLSSGPSPTRALITIGLMLGMLIAAMESTVVSTAMPTVIGDLHGIQLYPWVFSAYLLTSTTTVPIYGKLADVFGRRRVFLVAAAIFLAGSMLSGASHSMPQLIAFRGLQGLGAGGVLPLTLTIIGDLYTLTAERARVQSLFTSVWSVASLAGPLIGAVLTERFSWRWVFYINLPFGLVSALLVGSYLWESRERVRAVRIDLPGALLLTGGVLALLTLLLQAGNGASWLSGPMVLLLVLAIGLIAGFLWQERRAEDPMLPLSLFTQPVISACMLGNVLIGVMLYAMDSYMPLFMQGVRGGNAHSASRVLTPLILFWSISAFVGAKALVRWGFRPVALFGISCILTAAGMLTLIHGDTAVAWIVLAMVVLGSGLGPSSMTFLVSAQNAVDWRQRGVVTASSQFFRTIGGTVGVGALGAALNARMHSGLAQLHAENVGPNALLNTGARAALAPSMLRVIRQALESGLHLVYLLLALFALLAFAGIVRIALRWRPPLADSASEESWHRGDSRSGEAAPSALAD